MVVAREQDKLQETEVGVEATSYEEDKAVARKFLRELTLGHCNVLLCYSHVRFCGVVRLKTGLFRITRVFNKGDWKDTLAVVLNSLKDALLADQIEIKEGFGVYSLEFVTAMDEIVQRMPEPTMCQP